MNYIKEFMKQNGIAYDKAFDIVGLSGKYVINKQHRLIDPYNSKKDDLLLDLLTGDMVPVTIYAKFASDNGLMLNVRYDVYQDDKRLGTLTIYNNCISLDGPRDTNIFEVMGMIALNSARVEAQGMVTNE